MLFTREKLVQLKEQYSEAVKKGDDEFTFDGEAVLTSYAKYLIEYLETQLPKEVQ